VDRARKKQGFDAEHGYGLLMRFHASFLSAYRPGSWSGRAEPTDRRTPFRHSCNPVCARGFSVVTGCGGDAS
jgi:hypothetical protein